MNTSCAIRGIIDTIAPIIIMPSILTFAAKLPGVAYPMGNGAIGDDGSVTYTAVEGCEEYLPLLHFASLRGVFALLPKGAFLIVLEVESG